MQTRKAFLTLLIVGATLMPSLARAAPGPVEIVQDYLALWKTGSVSIAVDMHWSVDTTLRKSFGGDYDLLSPGERAYVMKLMDVQIVLPNTFPQVTSQIVDARLENFAVRGQTDTECEVQFDIVRATGEPLSNVMKLVYVEGKWKIYDVANGGKPSLVDAFTNMWAGVKGKLALPVIIDLLLSQTMSIKAKQYN